MYDIYDGVGDGLLGFPHDSIFPDILKFRKDQQFSFSMVWKPTEGTARASSAQTSEGVVSYVSTQWGRPSTPTMTQIIHVWYI